jgi:hypothetical protein
MAKRPSSEGNPVKTVARTPALAQQDDRTP